MSMRRAASGPQPLQEIWEPRGARIRRFMTPPCINGTFPFFVGYFRPVGRK